MRFLKNKGFFINLLKNTGREGQNSTRGAKIRPSAAFSGDFCRACVRRFPHTSGNTCAHTAAPEHVGASPYVSGTPPPADSRAGAFAARFYTRSGISRLFLARAPPTDCGGNLRRKNRSAAHGNCAGFFRRYIEIASANGYNRLKHMPAVRISAGFKFEKGRYYHENNPHTE